MPKPPPSDRVDKVGKRPPSDPIYERPIEEARAKELQGDLLAAAAILEAACEKAGEAPSDPKRASRLELALGRTYLADGRVDLAVERFQRAYKLDPDHVEAIEAGREVHATLGDFSTVARLYEVELELVPADDATRARRAALKAALGRLKARRLGDPGAAVVLLEEALSLATAGAREGGARSLGDEIREALAELYLSPDTPPPGGDGAAATERAAELFVELARRAGLRKDADEERRALKRALGADPYHPEAAERLEAAIQATGDDGELLKLYRGGAEVPERARKLAMAEARALAALGPAAPAKAQAAIDAVLDAARAGFDVTEAANVVRAALKPTGATPAAGTSSPTSSGTFAVVGGAASSPEKAAAARLAAFDEQLLDAELSSELLHPSAYADALVEVAARWRDAGETAREEAALESAYRADPSSPTAFAALVELKAGRRDHAGLLLLLATMDEAPLPEQPARLALLADALDKRLGDAAAALDAWRKTRAIAPGPKADMEIRRLKQKLERWASVTASLERELAAAPVGPARADALKRLAQVARERHDFARAAQLLEEALAIRPDEPLLHRALVDLHEASGQPDKVAVALRKQLKVSKEKVERLNLLRRLAALADDRLRDVEAVEEACGEILAILPGDRDALRRLEAAYRRAGAEREGELLAVLERHAQAAATPAERLPILVEVAALHEKRGDLTSAADRLDKAIKIDKADPTVLEALARVRAGLGQGAEAAILYERLLALPARAGEGDRLDAMRRFARVVDGQLRDGRRAVAAWREVLARRPSDREALEALAALGRTGAGDGEALLDEVLERRQQHAEGDEAVALLLERAALAEKRGARGQAEGLLRRVVEELAPGHLDAQARLRRLLLADGPSRVVEAVRIGERDLFLTHDPAVRLSIAVEIARAWTGVDAARAERAWERVVELDNENGEALAALVELYGARGEWERVFAIGEHRLALAQTTPEKVARAFELALVAEERIHDPDRAFTILEDALALEANDGIVAELRRLAESYQLWERMCAVYARQKGLEPRLRVAEIADEKLNDPRRAFAVLESSLGLDPRGEALQPELERLAARAGAWEELLGVYDALAERRTEAAARVELLVRRARVREERLRDAARALGELVRAYGLADRERAEVLRAEIHRLGAVTGRWDEVLSVEAARFHRTPRLEVDARVEIVVEAARLLEREAGEPRRAFHAWLAALELRPGDEGVRDELWRLARAIERGGGPTAATPVPVMPVAMGTAPPAAPTPAPKPPLPSASKPTAPAGGAAVVATKPQREPTLEIKLDDVMVDESGPIPVKPKKERADSTMELSVGDLVPFLGGNNRAAPPPRPRTVELSLSDRAVIGNSAAPPTPPPGALAARGPGRPPMAMPPSPPPDALATRGPAFVPQTALPTDAGPWEELAAVLAAGAMDRAARAAALFSVATMWETGAGDPRRAFAVLAEALRAAPDDVDILLELERLAGILSGWDELLAVLDDLIEAADVPARAVALLATSARVCRRLGRLDDAAARYDRALGIRPDDAELLDELETLYRDGGRDADLATLLERRLGGLLEKLPQGAARRARAVELSRTYERLGKSYEAISAWRRVADEQPDDRTAWDALARLYEAVGQWSKVVEALVKGADLLETSGDPAAVVEARGLRRRIGHIYLDELELPERALETFRALAEAAADAGAPDDDAELALERLYTQLGRRAELAALLERRAGRARDPREEAALLGRRADELERLGDANGLVAVLDRLLRLDGEKGDAAAREALTLRREAALARAERHAERAESIRARLARLVAGRPQPKEGDASSPSPSPSPSPESAQAEVALLVELARAAAAAGDAAEARRALERALTLQPKDAALLAELGRVAEGGADWDGYAATREREAEVAAPAEAVAALLEAARVHRAERRDPEAARRCLERALTVDAEAQPALAALADVLDELGHRADADRLAERELALPPERAPSLERQAALECRLAASALASRDLDGAARRYRRALSLAPGWPDASLGLADVAAESGAWDEVEALLTDAAERPDLPPHSAAELYRRLAEAADNQGRADDAYSALLSADRLQPNDLRTRLLLGENRYRAHRYREAAQVLGGLAEHPELAIYPVEGGEALYHAALAELKLRRPEKAFPLLERALTLAPSHEGALGLLADRALERGDVAQALSLLERQAAATPDAGLRAQRWERVADVMRDEPEANANLLGRAAFAYAEAVAAATAAGGDGASDELLDKTLRAQREAGQLGDAARLAAELLGRSAPPTVRGRRLREAAALDVALSGGASDRAEGWLREALALDQTDHEALAGLSAMLVQRGKDEDVAPLLTRTLSLLPPPQPGLERPRAALWVRLGEVRERLRDRAGAVAAFERALELDPARRPLRELVAARALELGPSADEAARRHLLALVAEEPFDPPRLRALADIEARRGAPDGGRRFLELLAVAGALDDDGRRRLSQTPAPASGDQPTTLDDAEHALFLPSELGDDGELLVAAMAALWEGVAADRTPAPSELAADPDRRVSPVGDDDLSRAFAMTGRALGNRRTAVYRRATSAPGDDAGLALTAHPPTAIVVGPKFEAGRSSADLRFLLGRALELLRPEYALAATLDDAAFARLVAATLRAFHPRHGPARGTDGDTDFEADALRKGMPYKPARRLAELFTAHPDVAVDPARWRAAAREAGARAGLLVAGDLVAAARVLRAEGDDAGLRALARFAVGDDYLTLRRRLFP